MSTSSKFDISSVSPDRLYVSGHGGSYSAASLDRSGSFRENMENPLLSSLPNMTRNSSCTTQGDVLNYFQCLRFDPKSMVVEHKLDRPAEFNRLASAAVGIPLEDPLAASSKTKQLSSPSLEGIRRLKSGARESGTKARERVKIFNDCLSVMNKIFPTIPSRKRSRLDALSNDRSNTKLSSGRSASGVGIGKTGFQNYASTSSLELELQKSEGRTKNAIPNKRTRTSVVDARMDLRANTHARPSGSMDRDTDIVRHFNNSAAQGEDRTSHIAGNGWKNSKMKKKRTSVKPDAAACSVTKKPLTGSRNPKQGMQSRLSTEASSRLIDDHGFRSGSANGNVGVGKAEATAQTSSVIRLSISRTDSDNSALLHKPREHPNGQDKERMNAKAVNRENSSEDFRSGSPTSSSKFNANVRGPRSGSVGAVSKLSQVVKRSMSSINSEVIGSNNRKRTHASQSSSPPVANWVQRPQKTSRTARTNLLPIVPGNDDDPAVDATPDMMVNEGHFLANSPQQFRLKSENSSPGALSESEESGATEIKSREKIRKTTEVDENRGQNVKKTSNLLLPPRKNKVLSGNDHGDGVRRQGRTARGFTGGKHGKVRTAKQIRSSRVGVDKMERAARPPTRKLSDGKAYTRQKHITVNMAADFLVGSENAHEELLSAANAVTKTAQALSSPFWKKMEHLFRFICDADISYLKDQVDLGSAVDTSALLDAGSSNFTPYGCRWNELVRGEIDSRCVELCAEYSDPGAKSPDGISLYQRLIASLIPEEENQELSCSGNEEQKSTAYGSIFDVEKNMESDAFSSRMSQDCDISGCPTSNGYRINANRRSFYELDENMCDNDVPTTDTSYGCLRNGLLAENLMLGTVCTEYQYQTMSLDEKVLLEVHSIGIYPDLVSGDEEVSEDICRMDEKYQEQVSRKKCMLGKLQKSASEAKELLEKEFDRCALDKLVAMAYEKYMGYWGPNAHGTKSASGKMAKQYALASIKQALERYQEYETTGKSCFSEPIYRKTLLSGISSLTDGSPLITDDEFDKLNLGTSGCSAEARNSVPGLMQQSPSNNQEMYSSEVIVSGNLGCEPTTGKEDSSNRVKRRELLLDDIGGTISSSPGVSSGLGGSLSCNAKGKRSERDRDGKGNRNTKIGRPASATVKGERKSKAKPKQKTAHLSPSVDHPLGKMSDQPKVMLSSTVKSSGIGKDKNVHNLDMLEEPIDLSGLQLPEMDDLGVSHDLGCQGEDIGSLLNFDDDGLLDHDYMDGLEIPMDDLSDLNMMV